MRANRACLLSGARGRTLELGAGTGLNLPAYPDAVGELLLSEPVVPMARRLAGRVARASATARVIEAPAEALPFDEDSCDTVVSTMVLCTVDDPGRAIAEIRRVLRPGGRLLFCEHVRAEGRLGRWQDRLERPWAAFAQGCRCNRRTVELIARELDLTRVERRQWRGMPALVRPLMIGEAAA